MMVVIGHFQTLEKFMFKKLKSKGRLPNHYNKNKKLFNSLDSKITIPDINRFPFDTIIQIT